jgi:uncharacterized protein (TIGR00297 family)
MEPLISYFIVMLPLAIVFNIPVLIIVLKKKLFTIPSGVFVAATLGVSFFLINPSFWLALVSFSLSSSLLTKMKTKEKRNIIIDFEKGSSQRDAHQVFANSLVPALFVIGYALFELIPGLTETGNMIVDPFHPFFITVFASFAVHNADTWATEIGILSSRSPRMIINPKMTVQPGTSGGVTVNGLTASILGGALLALLYFFLILIFTFTSIFDLQLLSITFIIIIAGLLGSVIDSIEGATIQGIYFCENCNKETESNPHPRCGSKTRLHRGNRYINNDFVNLTSDLLVSGLVFIIVVTIF